MQLTSLLSIADSAAFFSEASWSLSPIAFLFLLCAAAWWNKKKPETVEYAPIPNLQDQLNARDNGNEDAAKPEIPKPKSRGKRWKSTGIPKDAPLTPGEQSALEIEKKKVANLTTRLQQTELEFKVLKLKMNSPESSAKNRQLLLDKNKAIAERNKFEKQLQEFKDKAEELERSLAAIKPSEADLESSLAVQLKQAETSVAAMAAAKANLEDRLCIASQENEQLAEQLASVESEKLQLKTELAETEKARLRLESDLGEAGSDADELCKKIDLLQTKLETATDDAGDNELVQTQTEELKKLEALLKIAQDKQAVLESENNALVDFNQAEKRLVEEAATVQAELQSRVSSLETERTSIAAEFETATAENLRTAQQLDELQLELKSKNSAIDLAEVEQAKMLADLQNVQTSHCELESTIADLRGQLEKEVADTGQLREELRIARDGLADASGEIHELTAKNEVLETRLQSAEKRMENLIRDLDLAAEESVEWESKFLETHNSYKAELKRAEELTASNGEQQAELDRLQVDHSQLNAEHSRVQTEFTELQEVHDTLQSVHEATKDELKTATELTGKADEEIEVLAQRLEESATKLSELEAVVEELNQELALISDQAKDAEELRSLNFSLNESLAAKDSQCQEGLEQLRSLERQLADSNNWQTAAAEFEEQLISLRAESETWQSKLADAEERLVAGTGLAEEKSENSQVANEQLEHLETVNAQLERELGNVKEALAAQSKDLENSQSSLEDYRQEIFKRDTEIESLRNTENHSQEIAAEIKELTAERESLYARIASLELENSRHASQLASDVEVHSGAEADLIKLQEERDELKKRRRRVVKKYRQLNERFTAMQSDFSDSQRAHSLLEQQVIHAQKQNDLLSQQIALLKSNASPSDSDAPGGQHLQTVIEEFGERLAASHERYKKLAIQYRKTRSRYKRYKDRLVSYKNLVERYRDASGVSPSSLSADDSLAEDLAKRSP